MIIREAVTTADLDAYYTIRVEVFMQGQGVTEAEEFDGLDNTAIHLLGLDKGTPVAALRLRKLGAMGKIERVAVLEAHREKGYARAIMRAALERLTADPEISEAFLSAQTYIIPFYESMGFVAEGPEYLDAGIPHRDMRMTL